MEADLNKVFRLLAELGGQDQIEIDIRLRIPKTQEMVEEPLTVSPEETWIRKEEAKALLGCSATTIDNYAKSGKVKRMYRGRTPMFEKASVLRVLEPEGG